MGAIQPWHWIVLAIVVIALFGYNKLPDVTRSVGRSLRIFKTEMKGLSEDDRTRDSARTEVPAAPAEPVAPPPASAPTMSTPTVSTPTAPAATVPASATAVTPDGSATPTPEEIARAQAVLAAAARSSASGGGESSSVVPAAPAPSGPSQHEATSPVGGTADHAAH